MKKLLIMSAVAAMACGAWAVDRMYSFDLEIRNIPYSYSQLTGNATLYLIDTTSDKNLILAYGRAGEWDASSSDHDEYYSAKKSTTKGISHTDTGSVTIKGQTYVFASDSHQMQKGSSVTDRFFDANGVQLSVENDPESPNYAGPVDPTVAATKNVEFKIDAITGSTQIDQSISDTIALGQGSDNNLIAVLYDKDGGFYQLFDNVEYVDNAGTPRFQANGTYVVPEPTSGLLVLLGMAGLALRRRKAA